MAEKPEENGGFNREEYLREVEQFEDVEVVVAGRNSVRIGKAIINHLNPIHHSIFFLPLVTAGGGHHPPYHQK